MGEDQEDAFERVSSAQRLAVGTRFLRLRPVVVAPGIALASVLTRAYDIGIPQWSTMAGIMGTMLTLFSLEAFYYRSRQVSEWQLFGTLVFTTVGLGAACWATGGLGSPFVPMHFAPLVTTFAAFATSRLTWVHAGLVLVVLVVLGLLPQTFPNLPEPIAGPMTAMASIMAFVLLFLSVGGLARAFHWGGQALESERRQRLAEFEARYQSLEVVGAQVAHELKNPLAAMKGLVQLSARSAQGKSKARLEVVQKEIRRMEDTLRVYLSYGRPLPELNRQRTSVRQLCEELIGLFEARAERENVRLFTSCDDLHLTLDRTRMREVLMNLTCNAFDAVDAPHGIVELGCENTPSGQARLWVRDNGSKGLDKEKSFGNGLGMKVSETIVAEHGGTLRLFREDGATIAEIRMGAE